MKVSRKIEEELGHVPSTTSKQKMTRGDILSTTDLYEVKDARQPCLVTRKGWSWSCCLLAA